ncbi:hypothetical protein BD311DRAFT_766946 [Dichomitus squalens]|uniref:Uncharacterized protein n=1 Tax=Dichomitus squalens TaxID=114155 RepID=A0A4Q9MCK0_9APHY|nr:hypothetical protein BD311DRAFT_766946 [Dichomitus squalens]
MPDSSAIAHLRELMFLYQANADPHVVVARYAGWNVRRATYRGPKPYAFATYASGSSQSARVIYKYLTGLIRPTYVWIADRRRERDRNAVGCCLDLADADGNHHL